MADFIQIGSLPLELQADAIEAMEKRTKKRRKPQSPRGDKLWCGHPAADVVKHEEVDGFLGDDLVSVCPHCAKEEEP